jgi:hypothetical protein
MTDNEIISKFAGTLGMPDMRYDSYAELWTPELYQKIEDAGLIDEFCEDLCKLVWPDEFDQSQAMFEILRATPAQKASALAKAIKEGV